MIRLTDSGSTYTITVLNTRVTGRTINNTDRERRVGLMVLIMRVNTRKERSTVEVNLSLLMVLSMRGNSITMISTEKVLYQFIFSGTYIW
jgi:hypothetical protein